MCADDIYPMELPDGSLQGPDGIVYRRTPVRVKRRNGSELIAAGAPVVTDVYLDGMQWRSSDDARRAWSQIVPRLVRVVGGAVGGRRASRPWVHQPRAALTPHDRADLCQTSSA